MRPSALRAWRPPGLTPLSGAALFADHVPYAADGVNELTRIARVDLLSQVVDHDIHYVGSGIEVIPPGVLCDQGSAHDPARVAHQVLEHGVFLRRELDRASAARNLAGIQVQRQVGD